MHKKTSSHKHPPFGSNIERFGKNRAHPGLDPNGLYSSRPNGCDPGLYNPQPLHKIFEVNRNRVNKKDPWRYKNELEEWCKNLGYRNRKILDNRKWQNSILGPAWHTIPESSQLEPACLNTGFGRTRRFKTISYPWPGPGTYYKAVPFKAPYGPHSNRNTFDREEPCRFKDTSPSWSLAPNRYKIIDKDSIENKSKKIVSLRGPYDLFTGRRDHTLFKKCSAATWPLALKGCLEKYKKSRFGEMNKTNRDLPPRGRLAATNLAMRISIPDEPGPADYNLDKPKVFRRHKFGFNSSYDKGPGYQRTVVWPGVGRYKAKSINCGIPGHGHKHVFLSKQARTIGAIIQQPMNSF